MHNRPDYFGKKPIQFCKKMQNCITVLYNQKTLNTNYQRLTIYVKKNESTINSDKQPQTKIIFWKNHKKNDIKWSLFKTKKLRKLIECVINIK